MGLILDTNDPILGLEQRRESFNIIDLERQYPGEHGGERYREVLNIKSQHIFTYGDGEIEVSKDFLRKIVKFFDDPRNRRRLEDDCHDKGRGPRQ